MRPTSDLKRLCEGWWSRLSEATVDERSQFAEGFLEWFGWSEPVPVACPGDVTGRTGSLSYLLQTPHGDAAAAHFVPAGRLKPPSTVLEMNLDHCETTRLLVGATRAINIRYAFISDLYRAYLYDARSGELLLTADTPSGIELVFEDVLDRSAGPGEGLDNVRRHPRSHVARQLRDWQKRWSDRLIMDWQATQDEAELALDRLVFCRFLAERNVLRKTGWQFRTAFLELLARATQRPAGIGRDLTNLFRQLHVEWKGNIFSPAGRIEAILEQDSVATPLLAELGLMSRHRFQLLTVLESFNYGEAPEKARVRMIPEPNEERTFYLGKQTLESIDDIRLELDVDEEGYRAVLHWYDELVRLYQRLGQEYDQRLRESPERSKNSDLFAWSEADQNRPAALRDPMHHAMEHGLVFYYRSGRQRRTVRLLLLLHLIDSLAAARGKLVRFPRLEASLQPRPNVLESDRRRILGEIPEEDGWEAM